MYSQNYFSHPARSSDTAKNVYRQTTAATLNRCKQASAAATITPPANAAANAKIITRETAKATANAHANATPPATPHTRKKGFSLLETVIAFTLLLIALGMTVSSVLFVSSLMRRTDNVRFFSNECANYLECYKINGAQGFAATANEFLFSGSKIVAPDGGNAYQVVVVYNAKHTKQKIETISGLSVNANNYVENGFYVMVISIDKSFECVVYDAHAEVIFKSDKYYSRYDL